MFMKKKNSFVKYAAIETFPETVGTCDGSNVKPCTLVCITVPDLYDRGVCYFLLIFRFRLHSFHFTSYHHRNISSFRLHIFNCL